MNVLLIGSGGREHALAWALRKSPRLTKLYCAPGNGGIAEIAECVPLAVADHTAVIRFCADHAIDFVVVGPEAPLVSGLVDDLTTAGIKCFGPRQAAARLEGSKGFTKDLCREFGIPTAAYGRFDNVGAAKAYLKGQELPIVVKADGLAAGKGVTICETMAEAEAAVEACFAGAFGIAGAEVVIEEFLRGEEASFFALVDGKTALALAAAQDHKRVGDGDTGPNTGGMGAYSPAPVMTEAMIARTMDEIIRPTVAAMAARGTPFKGVLFAGLMITDEGPKLIEYNVRFGDPETQVLMLRLKSDLLAALLATADGTLAIGRAALARGRGTHCRHGGQRLSGAPATRQRDRGARSRQPRPRAWRSSMRAPAAKAAASSPTADACSHVTALGRTVGEAQARAYAAIAKIDWPGGFCRTDIGWRAVAREKSQA